MAAVRRKSRIHSNPNSPNYDRCLIKVNIYDMNREFDRRLSFIDNGWINQFIDFDDLAAIGFYYFKKPDYVKCAFCSVSIGNFEEGDTALTEHLKFSPNCPLLIGRITNNVPLETTNLNEILPQPSYDECGSTPEDETELKTLGEIAHPEYILLNQRIKSFETWPIGITQKPHELAEAGFIYTGQSDICICFACGVTLMNWENDDDCFVEHKNATKECSYLNLNQELLKLHEQKYEEFKKLKDSSTSDGCKYVEQEKVNDNDENKNFESLCKICMERKPNVVLLPCRHVGICSSCVFGINDICPICRTEVEEKINLFYA